jgi:hypothetical protein
MVKNVIGGTMYSIELAIIIPVIIILLVTALMMFQFVIELGLFEIYHSRHFMLSLSEPASLNGKITTIESLQSPYQVVRTKYQHEALQVGLNAFEILNGKSNYHFKTHFYAVKNNRIALSFVKTGYDEFMNMDR